MKLTKARMVRYLQKQKKLNDYLLKIASKDRVANVKLSFARCKLLEGEESLRNLIKHLN